MKKIYFVTGLGCTGKTTFSQLIAKELGIPAYKADDVYYLAKQKLGIPNEAMAELAMAKTWESNYDWQEYKTPEALLEICYNELLSYNLPDVFVLEGQGLFWNHFERDLVHKLFADYDKRYLVINPDYEQWLKNRSARKLLPNEVVPKFLEEADYYKAQEELLSYVPKLNRMVLTDPKQMICSPTGGVTYQELEFSDPKWEVFDFPKDMSGKSFLDISCNGGWFCRRAGYQGAGVHGVDISWQVLDIAMDRNPEGTFHLSKIEDFDTTEQFDYLLCSSAFHYYKHREEQVAKLARLSKYVIFEMPVIDTDDLEINYQGGEDNQFCSVVSRGLIEKWLAKYFKEVVLIGYTNQPNSHPRPVWRCTN